MKCDELKPLMCAHEPNVRPMYDKSEVDKAIAELKDKCQMHDFFWEVCGFKKLGFKNSIDVRDYCDELKRQNEDLLLKCRKANMENRRLKRALWLARAERAKTEHLSKIMYSTLFRDFIAKWVNVERKCRVKAEEFK